MDTIVLSADFASASRSMASHLHDSHQLLYVTGGQSQITVSDNTYHAKAGTLILINRFETHSVQDSSPDYCRYTLQISPEVSIYSKVVGYPVLSVLTNRPTHFRHALDMSGVPEFEQLLCQIVAEKADGLPLGNKLLDLKFLQLLLCLCRAHPELISQPGGGLDLVRRVQSYFENNYAAKLSLEDVARTFHLSPSHLSHRFKQITGVSVMGYLQACRLAEAKQQLAQTDLPVRTIIDACGYSDSSNFSQHFKSATGLTPTQFRKQHR